jgi:hypothetical protein
MNELPCSVNELRETLNEIVALKQRNKQLVEQSVKDSRTISHLRQNIAKLMTRILRLELKHGVNH